MAFFLGLRVERGFLAGEVEGVVLLLPGMRKAERRGGLVVCIMKQRKV